MNLARLFSQELPTGLWQLLAPKNSSTVAFVSPFAFACVESELLFVISQICWSHSLSSLSGFVLILQGGGFIPLAETPAGVILNAGKVTFAQPLRSLLLQITALTFRMN